MLAKTERSCPASADLTALFERCARNALRVGGRRQQLGKSALLRALTTPAVQAQYLGEEAKDYLFIYIDFNQMLEMSEQGILRAGPALRARCPAPLPGSTAKSPGRSRQRTPAWWPRPAPFEVPLRFTQGMAAIGDLLPQQVVLLFDELDGPVAEHRRPRVSQPPRAEGPALAGPDLHHRHQPPAGPDLPGRTGRRSRRGGIRGVVRPPHALHLAAQR